MVILNNSEGAYDDNKYSFSKLSSFNNCKYGFYQQYIEHKFGVGNCFSSYGTLLHSLLERYATGKLSLGDLVNTYEWEFNTYVPESFPNTKYCPDMRKLYYEQGFEFLKKFKGYSGLDILEVEKKFTIPLFDWDFTGVIDLVFIDKLTNELVVRDWKSKASFKSKTEENKYMRQLYLYSIYLKDKYGKYPDKLQFYLFRKNKVIETPFNEEGLKEAMDWANNTVKEIRQCWSYPPSPEPWFCNQLCNYRLECPYKAKDDDNI